MPLHWILVFVIAIVFASLNVIELIIYKLQQPTGTLYIGIIHWYEDYFFYLSHLTQGAAGAWLTHNSFTTEPIPQTLIWWYNILLGKVVAITNLYPWIIYDGSVVVLSIVSIVFDYVVLRALFPTRKVAAIISLLIALTATALFTVTQINGVWTIKPITFFYTYTLAFNRLGGASHLIAQNILSLFLIFTYSLFMTSRRPLWQWISLITPTFLFLFIISPVYVFVDTLVIFLCVAYFLLTHKHIKGAVVLFSPLCISLLVTTPFLIKESQSFSHFFYQWMRAWETRMTATSLAIFLSSMGAIVPFVLLGIKPFLSVKSPLRVMGTLFAFLPILLYFSQIPTLFRLPVFRFLEPPAYVFFAAFAYEGGGTLARIIHGLANIRLSWITTTIFVLFFLIQLPVLSWEIQNRITLYYLSSPLNYLDKNIYTGLATLKNSPPDSVVLATHNLEFFVPVVSGLTTYSGHRSLTYEYERKAREVFDFYEGHMTSSQAKTFITMNNIRFVLVVKQNGDTVPTAYYPFLKKIFENPSLLIFSPR